MRSEIEVSLFRTSMLERYADEGHPGVAFYTACYEAGIPRTFWDVCGADIRYNRATFDGVILRYCAKMKVALKRGYSLLLTGDNGAGKTIFISYVLTQALRRGRTAYYTTLAQLDADIKRGFRDSAADKRLQYLIEADIIAIDEVGKEYFRSDSWLMAQLEQLLKRRYDDGDPVLLATNLSYEAVVSMYGPSIESMLEGKYTTVALDAGDYRKAGAARMKQELGIR